jgi:hypothetical protein
MENLERIPSFIQFDDGEVFERDFYVAHTSKKRFPVSAIMIILVGLSCYVVPGLILLVYFAVRRLRVTHAFAAVTNKRVVFYEYNDHPAVNTRAVRSLYIRDVTAITARVAKSPLKRSFVTALYTERKAIAMGAESWLSFLKALGKEDILEPGPEALEFIQVMMGQIAEHRRGSAPDPSVYSL